MMRISVEYPACYRRWTVEELSDSRSVARLRLAGNQKSLISDNGVNAGILSLKKIASERRATRLTAKRRETG